MKTKKIFALIFTTVILFTSAATVYAGSHHGGHHNAGQAIAWHKATDYYAGHYSNKCVQYDHSWHVETDSYEGHYSYDCIGFGHDYNHDVCNSGYHH